MKKTMMGLGLGMMVLAACNNGSSGSAGSGGVTGAAAAATTNAPAAAKPAAKTPTTKLTGQQINDAYDAAFHGQHMMDPFDKQLAIVKGKLGDPNKVDGDTSIWWGWMPKQGNQDPDCMELKMSPTKGSSSGGSDWKNCGMGG